MPSPPKPWERAGATAATAASSAPIPASMPTSSTSTATPSSSVPSVPARPTTLSGASSTLANTSAYGASPYSSYSPYNRYGSSYSPYGSSMYGGGMGYSMGSMGAMGGMGGMGGMGYGGYSPYGGGMGGYGGGMYGAPLPGADPNNPSLTQALEGATQHTFALIQSIVQTFGGVAQMLESTFVATHSSFFAMVGVIDQLGQLRAALGSVLGLFGLVRWLRDKITGRTRDPLRSEFKDFVAGRPVQAQAGPPAPRASKKPLIIFLLAVLGVPYLMHRLVRTLVARQQALAEQQGAGLPPLDPSQLMFARALYPFEAASPAELALRENEIVAIMGKLDPVSGAEVDPRLEVEGSEWWKGRTREGREGWFPKKFIQLLERRKPIDAPAAEPKKVE